MAEVVTVVAVPVAVVPAAEEKALVEAAPEAVGMAMVVRALLMVVEGAC